MQRHFGRKLAGCALARPCTLADWLCGPRPNALWVLSAQSRCLEVLLRDVFSLCGDDVTWEGVEIASYWTKLGKLAKADGVYRRCLQLTDDRYVFNGAALGASSSGSCGRADDAAGKAPSACVPQPGSPVCGERFSSAGGVFAVGFAAGAIAAALALVALRRK